MFRIKRTSIQTDLYVRFSFHAPLHAPPSPFSCGGGDLSGRSEGIVLRGDLSDVIVADDGHLAEDVISNLGDFAEEEEGEDSGRDTEARCYAAAVEGACVSRSLSLCH